MRCAFRMRLHRLSFIPAWCLQGEIRQAKGSPQRVLGPCAPGRHRGGPGARVWSQVYCCPARGPQATCLDSPVSWKQRPAPHQFFGLWVSRHPWSVPGPGHTAVPSLGCGVSGGQETSQYLRGPKSCEAQKRKVFSREADRYTHVCVCKSRSKGPVTRCRPRGPQPVGGELQTQESQPWAPLLSPQAEQARVPAGPADSLSALMFCSHPRLIGRGPPTPGRHLLYSVHGVRCPSHPETAESCSTKCLGPRGPATRTGKASCCRADFHPVVREGRRGSVVGPPQGLSMAWERHGGLCVVKRMDTGPHLWPSTGPDHQAAPGLRSC